MVINWYGQSCFKLQSGELVVVIDPYGKELGLTPPRFRADLALVTHGHFDHAYTESLSGNPFVISGPGEFEVKDISVIGIESFHDDERGKKRGSNTIYKIVMEEIRVVHMGDFGEEKLRDETLEQIGDVDILFIPVGGIYTIDASGAAKIIKQIEPRFVIPMHYKIPGLKVTLNSVDTFLKEMGAGKLETRDKFSVKQNNIGENEKTEIIVLNTV